MKFPRSGIYQHYKGPLYLVLGIAHDADEEGRNVVVYVPLELNSAHTGPRLAVRTAETFEEWVDFRTGAGLEDSDPRALRRFTWMGETLEVDSD